VTAPEWNRLPLSIVNPNQQTPETRPSKTALRVAMHRAAHQLLDQPKVFDDPLALAIIGPKAVAELDSVQTRYGEQVARNLRAFLAVRSRYAEDELAAAIGRGVKQYVVLGAGLDTFAYRNPYPESVLRVFEVNHPATQDWKRGRLAAAGISVPRSLTFAPVDFENDETLAVGLGESNFDSSAATFFSWLGVTMYLTEYEAISTLDFIASTPPGGGVVFDFAVPRTSLDPAAQVALDALSARVAAAGEPFQTFFDPTELTESLRKMGFSSIEDMDANAINARYFQDRSDELYVSSRLGRLMSTQIRGRVESV
jgi:methyltransferase (TIGR00027 family)